MSWTAGYSVVKRTKANKRRIFHIVFTLSLFTSTCRAEKFHPETMVLVGQQSALCSFQGAKPAIADG